MEKWSKVDSKIKAADLEQTKAEFYAAQLQLEKEQREPEKHFQKQNRKVLKRIASDFNANEQRRAQTAQAKREKETRYQGRLPAYLVKMKQQDALDKVKT